MSLLNRFTFTFSPGWSVDGVAVDPQEHLTLRTARRAAEQFSTSLVGLHVVQQEGVPRERGLGSSATARVAGMLAVLSRSSEAPPLDDQLEFLAADEGHPDNVVPALVGGLNIITRDGEARLRTLRLAPPKGLAVALCIPDRPVATEQARAILPDEVSRADALFNVSRVACLLVGLLEGRVDALALGVEDRLHQPWRAPLIGPVDQAFAMARSLGGAAPFISGSGSTLACFVPEGVDADAVADAMCGPFRAQGSAARAHVARPLARGALIS